MTFIESRKYFVLLGGFLLHLTIGNLYSYNNMSTNIVDYMKNNSLDKKLVQNNNLPIWIFSLSVFGLGSSISLGGILASKIGSSLTVLIGGWFMSFNILLLSYTMRTYSAIVIISYGLLKGIGSGLVYGVSIGAVLKWFPEKKGFICGIVVSGFGLSSFIFETLLFLFDKTSEELPAAYIAIGSVYIIIQFIASLLLIDAPQVEETQLSSNIGYKDSNSSSILDRNDRLEINIKPHNLYFELDYWIMWITLALLSACFTLLVSQSKDYGVYMGFTKYHVATATILGSIFNSFYRILWGYFIDKRKYKTLMLILTSLFSLFFGTFYFCQSIEDDFWKYVFYLIWTVILYSLSSGMFSIFPFMCCKLFGMKYFTSNFGLIFTAYSFAGLLTGIFGTLNSTKNNFLPIFISGFVMSLFAGLITLVYRGRSLIHKITLFD